MSFLRFIKRFFFGIVLCVVAIWCFSKVIMPFMGEVPWSTGNIIWVIVLGTVGVLALIWAFNLFISTVRMTINASRPPLPSGNPQSLTKEEQERYEQALQAANLNPQSFEAWANLGYIEHKLDKNEDALKSANKALTLNKRYARAWMVRGAALSTMDGQENKALDALNIALREDENNIDALYYKGRIFVFQEKDIDAHEMFDSVLALNPRYKEALISKGTAYIVTEDYNEALAVTQKLISRFPNDAVGWRMQGTAYCFQGEKKDVESEKKFDLLTKALASFNKALEIDPTDSNTYLMKAGPYVAIGDYGKALEALNQGLKIDPTNTQLQEAKADIVGKRTKETASKVAGTAGRMALGGGVELAKGYGRVGKMFWDTLKDDMRKP